MPKKKFINGSVAKYALLPGRKDSTVPLSWIRTDSNHRFEPFAEVEEDTTQLKTLPNHNHAVGPSSHTGQPIKQTTTLPFRPDNCYDYERHLRTIGTDPTAIYLNAKILDRTIHSAGESSSIMRTESQQHREDNQCSEDDSDLDFNLIDADSNFSDEDELDEYDAFFNQILVARSPEAESHRRHPNDTLQPLHRSGSKEQKRRGNMINDSSFNDFMRVYDSSNDQETHPNAPSIFGTDDEILGAIADISLVSKATETEHKGFSPKAQVHADRASFEDNAQEMERSINFRSNMDCETVLSSYSILDNHPKLLVVSSTKQQSKKYRDAYQLGIRLADLANEFGAGNSSCVQEAHDSRWRQNLARKGENHEEKKLRKAAVKKGRKEARELKKGLKDAFKREETRQRSSIGQANALPSNASVKKFD